VGSVERLVQGLLVGEFILVHLAQPGDDRRQREIGHRVVPGFGGSEYLAALFDDRPRGSRERLGRTLHVIHAMPLHAHTPDLQLGGPGHVGDALGDQLGGATELVRIAAHCAVT
jgi:hypothetical protein